MAVKVTSLYAAGATATQHVVQQLRKLRQPPSFLMWFARGMSPTYVDEVAAELTNEANVVVGGGTGQGLDGPHIRSAPPCLCEHNTQLTVLRDPTCRVDRWRRGVEWNRGVGGGCACGYARASFNGLLHSWKNCF